MGHMTQRLWKKRHLSMKNIKLLNHYRAAVCPVVKAPSTDSSVQCPVFIIINALGTFSCCSGFKCLPIRALMFSTEVSEIFFCKIKWAHTHNHWQSDTQTHTHTHTHTHAQLLEKCSHSDSTLSYFLFFLSNFSVTKTWLLWILCIDTLKMGLIILENKI